MSRIGSRSLLLAIGAATTLPAQLPHLAPTTDTVLLVDATQGRFAFASITIPAGVTVRFDSGTPWQTGTPPVRIECAGNATIDGTLSVSPPPSFLVTRNGPGAVATGAGQAGLMTFQQNPWGPIGTGSWVGTTGGPASHASRYGTALPFGLAGGSPGGTTTYDGGIFGPFRAPEAGGGGGGTLVLEAQGRIDVAGTITAREGAGVGGQGAGGSILLRGLRGIHLQAAARVDAGREGIVRLDSYDQVLSPATLGQVAPAPTALRLPDLAETGAPVLGATWELRVIAPRGDSVFLAASFVPGSGTTPYGTVGIDLATAITFAIVTVPATGVDPSATFSLPVPNLPQLLGLRLWTQGLNWFSNQPPRYTQTVVSTVR